jgi:ubiquitin C-terminal hydrolase
VTPFHSRDDDPFVNTDWYYYPQYMRKISPYGISTVSTPQRYLADVMSINCASIVGLQNLGATCYMNSLMQQLFMVPEVISLSLSLSGRGV